MARRLVCKTGTYVDNQGATKNRWTNIGVMMSNDNGEYILLDGSVSLAGIMGLQNQMTDQQRGNIMVSIFDDDNKDAGLKQRPQNNNQQQQSAPAGDPFDSDIPFCSVKFLW
jgi:hypothetical protein